MISLLGMMFRGVGAFPFGFSCGPTGTPNSLDMLSTLATNRRIEKCQNISPEFGGLVLEDLELQRIRSK
jgi:hypothetical protein